MSEFIVLGLIPGTQIQITFIFWSLLVVALLTVILVKLVRRTHILRNWVISLSLLMLTRQTITRP